MVATTVTSGQVAHKEAYGETPGLNVRHAKLNWRSDMGSDTLSVSVCAQMVPMPHGARILNVVAQVTGQAGQVGSYVVGESLTNRFLTVMSLTASTVVNRNFQAAAYGYRISVSESDNVVLDTIDLTFGANVSSTLTLCVDMLVYYVMDRDNVGEV